MQRFHAHVIACCVLLTLVLFVGAGGAVAGQISGAVYTTLMDGTEVNLNIYDYKEDVWFAGGPGPNAPPTAAGLPEGDYYFMVTDPSGKVLLSEDPIECRGVHVNEYGVISGVLPLPGGAAQIVITNKPGNKILATYGPHAVYSGPDVPHNDVGAVTVELMPYADTPNKGGTYKLWLTPVDAYSPGQGVHGFISAYCKTDNFKVRESANGGGPGTYDFYLTVRKFNDANVSTIWDTGEEEVTGWQIQVTDPDGVTNNYWTPVLVQITREETDGAFVVESVEDQPAGTLQTVAILDGVMISAYPTAQPLVTVDFAARTDGETHEVVYGNVGLGRVQASKFYDRDGDGEPDEGEPPVEGWRMELVGIDVLGAVVGPIVQATDATGVTVFDGLLPGTYDVTELIPPPSSVEWQTENDTIASFSIVSTVEGPLVVGSTVDVTFGNYATGEADFGTKGYWHNKNGLSELTGDDIAFVNTLSPYSSPSSYFDAGDEPFDGLFQDGTPVAASNGVLGEIAPAGSAEAEISQFLVDANAGGDPLEQLAQQLLAFIFNSLHRLDDPAAAVLTPEGYVSAAALVAEAIAIWESGTEAEQIEMKDLLDLLNNSDALPFIYFNPPPVVYP